MTDLMNDEAVCRTAPATPGLLNIIPHIYLADPATPGAAILTLFYSIHSLCNYDLIFSNPAPKWIKDQTIKWFIT